MILQGAGHAVPYLGVSHANDPRKGGYMAYSPALDLTAQRKICPPPPPGDAEVVKQNSGAKPSFVCHGGKGVGEEALEGRHCLCPAPITEGVGGVGAGPGGRHPLTTAQRLRAQCNKSHKMPRRLTCEVTRDQKSGHYRKHTLTHCWSMQ